MASPRRPLPPPLTEKERAFVVHTYLSHGRSLTAVRELWARAYGVQRPVPSRTTFWRAVHKFETQASLADGRKTNRRPKMSDGRVEALVLKLFQAEPNLSIRDATRMLTSQLQRGVSRGTVHKIVTEHKIAGRTNRQSYRANGPSSSSSLLPAGATAAAMLHSAVLGHQAAGGSGNCTLPLPEVPKRRRGGQQQQRQPVQNQCAPVLMRPCGGGADDDRLAHSVVQVGGEFAPHLPSASTSAIVANGGADADEPTYDTTCGGGELGTSTSADDADIVSLSAFVRRCLPPLDGGDPDEAAATAVNVLLLAPADAAEVGAVYCAAMAAVLAGADRVDVLWGGRAAGDLRAALAQRSAAVRVHDCFADTDGGEQRAPSDWPRCNELLSAAHALVLLASAWPAGRLMHDAAARRVPVVLLGDALDLTTATAADSATPHGCRWADCALLPATVHQLRRALAAHCDGHVDRGTVCRSAASALGGATVLMQGRQDFVTDGERAVECSSGGPLRRCTGQSELLAGVLAVFAAWARRRQLRHGPTVDCTLLQAAHAASTLARRTGELVCTRAGRCATSGDLLSCLPEAYGELVEAALDYDCSAGSAA